MESKKRFDNTYRLYSKKIILVSDLILLFNSVRAIDMFSSKKLRFRWLGPYRIYTAHQDKGTYILEELDGTMFRHIITSNRLKPFHVRTAYADIGGQGTTTLLRKDETN
jgi:hypothetical protein